jgi:hypothetical protein
VRLLLFFELFLELGVGLLEIAEIILEEPRLSSLLQLQLVKLSLKINVLRQRAPSGHSQLLSVFRSSFVSA